MTQWQLRLFPYKPHILQLLLISIQKCCVHAVLIRPNLTGSKPKLNPGITSWVTPGLTEWTQSKPIVNLKWTQSKPRWDANFQTADPE